MRTCGGSSTWVDLVVPGISGCQTPALAVPPGDVLDATNSDIVRVTVLRDEPRYREANDLLGLAFDRRK